MAVAASAVLAGCGAQGVPLVGGPSRDAALEDRVWLETGPEAEAGAFKIFLSDGTLVEGACGAPYRLAAWRKVEPGTIAWEEPDGPVRAAIAVAGPEELGLVVDPEGAARGESYSHGRSPGGC